MKPVIRVRLVPCINLLRSISLGRTVRGEGPDTWEAKLIITSSEGHTSVKTFSSESKSAALNEAYSWLKKNSITKWFPKFLNDMEERYGDYFVGKFTDERVERFTHELGLVESGKIPTEVFIKRWDKKLAEANLQTEPGTPQPKKWKWYHWFWNPEGDK